jgi:hypothetical protein
MFGKRALVIIGLMLVFSISIITPVSSIPAEEDEFTIRNGLGYYCQPYDNEDGPINISSMSEADNISWIASWNLTSAEWMYYYITESGNFGENFVLDYSTGFAIQMTHSSIINYSSFDMPAAFAVEPGLSLHGNVAPEDLPISHMVESADGRISWCAQYNYTSSEFEYYYPLTDTGIDFECPMFGGVWFYTDPESDGSFLVYAGEMMPT